MAATVVDSRIGSGADRLAATQRVAARADVSEVDHARVDASWRRVLPGEVIEPIQHRLRIARSALGGRDDEAVRGEVGQQAA